MLFHSCRFVKHGEVHYQYDRVEVGSVFVRVSLRLGASPKTLSSIGKYDTEPRRVAFRDIHGISENDDIEDSFLDVVLGVDTEGEAGCGEAESGDTAANSWLTRSVGGGSMVKTPSGASLSQSNGSTSSAKVRWGLALADSGAKRRRATL